MVPIKMVFAETIIELPTGRTASKPFKVLGVDSKIYFVKPLLDAQPKVLPNELVGSILASILELPTPSFALIECAPELMRLISIPSLQHGVYFGSEFLEGSIDFNPSSGLGTRRPLDKITLLNEDALPGVVAFDNWVLNNDRNNAGNNLLVFAQEERAATYYMIDFGHCFTGPSWTKATLTGSKDTRNPVSMFPFIQERIRNLGLRFDEDKLEHISGSIFEVVDCVPETWPLMPEEANALKEFLNHRISVVREMIKDGLLQ